MSSSPSHMDARHQKRRAVALIIGSSVVVAGALVVALVLLNGRSKAATMEDAGGRTLGRSDAPVKLDLWADFQCPTCAVFTKSIKPALIDTFVKTGKANLTFHDMAFLGSESVQAAVGARCAERQKKFWPYHDLLFENQGQKESGAFAWERLKSFGVTLGLDMDGFIRCLADPGVTEAVEADTKRAYVIHIKETPTLAVNGKPVPQVMDWLWVRSAIETALRESSAPAAR
jgi:protein-disulfide isomerase